MKASSIKLAKLLLKAIFVFSSLFYVFYNQDMGLIWQYMLQGEIKFIFYAMLFLTCLIIGSGLRFRVYLSSLDVKVNHFFTIILTYIGMFFNLFLPGGIGGDGYLAYYTSKKYKVKPLSAVRIMIAGRANGLFFLNILFFVLFLMSDFAAFIPHPEYTVLAVFVAQVIVYYFVSKFILKETLPLFFMAGGYSALLQIFSMLAAMFVFFSLGLQNNFANYLVLYFAAAVIAVLPISPGGIGTRELIFFEGAKLLGLNTEFAVAASLLFFAVFALASLLGLVFYLCLGKLEKRFQGNYTED